MFQRTYNPIYVALVFAIVTISVTFFYARSNAKKNDLAEGGVAGEIATTSPQRIRGIQQDDHVLGNPNAKILFFVYSDFSCPFCKDYHETLKTIMKVFGSGGDVAIVYRHLPFVQLHPESPMYALASECVAKEAGNVGFWKFANLLFENTDPLAPLEAGGLVVFAEQVGVSKQSFVACMRSNELMANIERDFQEGISAGANGSPFTVLDMYGQRAEFQGAQSYRSIALMVQTAVRSHEIDGDVQSPSESTSGQTFINDFYLYDENASSSTTTLQRATTTTQ